MYGQCFGNSLCIVIVLVKECAGSMYSYISHGYLTTGIRLIKVTYI